MLADSSVESVVAVAASRAQHADGLPEIVFLSTGVRARLRPVSSSLISDIIQRIADPPVPVWLNPDKGREEENPSDPAYQRALAEVTTRRGSAATDAAIMFGVELVDPLPKDGWDVKLQFVGIPVPEDDFGREFAYKKYVAVGAPDLLRLMGLAGIPQEEATAALRGFPDKP